MLRVEAEGYEASEQALPEGALAGARIGAALRPSGFDGARVVELDAADSLAQVAAHLARRGGRPQDAIAYAERAIALEPRTALAHRALGDARAVLGDGAPRGGRLGGVSEARAGCSRRAARWRTGSRGRARRRRRPGEVRGWATTSTATRRRGRSGSSS